MLQGPFDLSRWLLLAAMFLFVHRSNASPFENKTGSNESRPRIFSPRMDYDEWTPLGRGDPLKNDPTFDYVPPVLDRVQYWLDSHTTEPSAKRDILVLGVTAKKTSPKIPEHFLKFVDGPKFNRNQDTLFRNDYTGSTGAEPPKLIRNNNFRNGPIDFRNQNRIQSLPASYYPSPFYNHKSKPYTMMMPPPLNQKSISEGQNSYGNPVKEKIIFSEQQFSTQTEEGPTLQDYNHPPKTFSQGHQPLRSTYSHVSPPPLKPKQPIMIPQMENMQSVFTPSQIPNQIFEVTTPTVSFEKSNLIYQSTQTLSGGWLGSSRPTSSVPPVEINQITWKTPDRYEVDHHGSASANHEVVIGQNANIIVDGDSNDNEEVVIGHKGSTFQQSPSHGHFQKDQEQKSHSEEGHLEEGLSADGIQSIRPSTDDESSSASPTGPFKMHIVVANSPSSLDLGNQKEPVSVVMPTNYIEKKQHSNLNSAESTRLASKQNASSLSQNNISKIQNSNPMINSNLMHQNGYSTNQNGNTVNQNGNSMNQNTNSMNQNTNSMNQNTNSMNQNSNIKIQNGNSMSSQEFLNSPESISADFMSSHSSMERPDQVLKPQPFRSSISSPMMPLFMEDTQTAYPSNILSNRMPATRHTPPRYPGFNIFGEPVSQQLALQHPRPMMMHRPGENRPGFRPPMSMTMGHMPPSITHMHMPPPESVMGPPMSSDQTYQRHQEHQKHEEHQQPGQLFPTTFTSSPAGSASTLQVTRARNQMILTTMKSSIFPPTTRGPLSINEKGFLDFTRNQSPLIQLLNNEESQKVEMGSSPVFDPRPSSLQTTTVPSLTTDPIFSHYKQPAKPIRGPMYLIIQGHSKVKTYKPTVNKYGVPVENNEILDNTTERPQSKLEKLVNENEKANAVIREKDLNARKKMEERKENRGGPTNLLSFVENGFSAFTVSPSPATEQERQVNSVTTIEINNN